MGALGVSLSSVGMSRGTHFILTEQMPDIRLSAVQIVTLVKDAVGIESDEKVRLNCVCVDHLVKAKNQIVPLLIIIISGGIQV